MSNRRVSNSNYTSGASVAAADQVLRKESEFIQAVKKLDANNLILAQLLAHGGSIENSVNGALKEDDEGQRDFQSFLQEQRERVKGMTEMHIKTARHTDAFISAVNQVRTDILNAEINNAEETADEKPPDYELILRTKLELQKQQNETMAISLQYEQMMQKVKERLREPTQRSNADDDDDIEIEISNTESSAEFKCPITAQFMQKPMRNKVCKHVYEDAGIKLILKKKTQCPIAGCNNRHVTLDQLEEDMELQLKIARFVKREEQQKRMRMDQIADFGEDGYVVDVDNMNNNFTVCD